MEVDVTRKTLTRFPRRFRISSRAALAALILAAPAGAEDATERVRGYFCDAKADQVAFLSLQAEGENEIMAANAVNKSIAKASCAYYLPADALPTGEHTVMDRGLVFKLESFVFLPEKVERWRGTVLGSLRATAQKQDI
jgi:hypothetical protein